MNTINVTPITRKAKNRFSNIIICNNELRILSWYAYSSLGTILGTLPFSNYGDNKA